MAKYLYEESKEFKSQKDRQLSAKTLVVENQIDEGKNTSFSSELKVRNDKIILPEFAYNMTNFKDEEDIIIKVSKNKIEIIREDDED